MTASSQTELLAQARQSFAARDLERARNEFAAALAMSPAGAGDYNDYGRVLNNLRRHDEARQAFASAVALDSEFAEAHNNLGHVLRALNEADEAAASFRRAVALRPDYVRAWQNLGTVLALTGDYAEAISAQEQALALAPGEADAHLNLAGLYRVTDAPDKAEKHIRQAMALRPELIDARIQLGSLLESRGEIEQAIDCYRKALALDPINPEALAGLADVMDKSGRYEEALALLQPGLEAQPDDPRLAVARARLLRRVEKSDEALAVLAAARTAKPVETERLPRYFFTLGELYDQKGEFDAAFASYQRANALKQEPFNPAHVVEAVDALINVFTPGFFASAPVSDNLSERPVFVVGMPRSGTSLVEQIIASHPDAYGAGELRLVTDIVKGMGSDETLAGLYPECLTSITRERLNKIASAYLDELSSMNTAALRVTDKMPHNFLHLGLIHMLFPRAHVIHCVRNKLDTILSCYFQDFASSAMAFSNDLDHLAIYYAQYYRLMAHWRKVLPDGFKETQYESLVENFEGVAKDMLDYVGLEWDDAVTGFHKNRRLVKTASHAQVRQPIYKRSLARHVHYEKHLTGVRASLDGLLEQDEAAG